MAAGHFTTMQVRGGSVQGLDLHLERLRVANRALFDAGLDEAALRRRLRDALGGAGGAPDCTLRIVARHAGGDVGIAIEVEAPRSVPASALRLRSHGGLRSRPELKHLAIAPQLEARAAAQAAGCDDALLVDAGGLVAEGTFWNIALLDGRGVLWPEAPALDGVTRRLLQRALRDAGVPQRHAAVRLDELPAMHAAFALNSRGVQRIGAVDGHAFGGDEAPFSRLRALLAGVPWQRP